MRPRIGSLFSGYGGLEMGVQAVLGGSVAWHSEVDPGACKILAARYPDVLNLGDITAVDWSAVEPVDVLTGGFPCQDVSCAGLRKGLRPDTRSGLWTQMAYAIDRLRPSLVVAENVRGLLSAEAHSDLEPCPWCLGDGGGIPLRALGAVLGDLADLGYDASWQGLRAADIGAPHGRFRVFVVAWPAADAGRLQGDAGRLSTPREATGRRALAVLGECRRVDAAAHADGSPLWQQSVALVGRGGAPVPGLAGADAAADSQSDPRRLGDGDGGAPAAYADSDGLSGQPRTPAGRDAVRADQRNHLDRCRDDSRRGGELNALSAEDRSGEALRNLRGADGAEALQRPARGSGSIPPAAALLAGMCEQQDRGDEGRAPLAGQASPEAGVRGVRDGAESARPSRRPESREQQPGESADALLVVSPAAALAGGPREAAGRCQAGGGYGCSSWGQYAPAIHRWEMVLGRLAPPPTELSPKGTHRLSALAVEFLMGLPAGWVTDVPGLGRNEQLKALGNGVVPQQAEHALRLLLPDARAAA